MNPTSNEHGELRLPAPVSELPPDATGQNLDPNMSSNSVPEMAPSGPELKTQNPAAGMPQMTAVPLPPMPATPPPTATDDVASTTSSDVPNTADDVDLIEKEWVHKAKQIVERTRDNPHEQSKEMTVFKADYIKKRYNKTIKLSE